jgi:hypothetical protein
MLSLHEKAGLLLPQLNAQLVLPVPGQQQQAQTLVLLIVQMQGLAARPQKQG